MRQGSFSAERNGSSLPGLGILADTVAGSGARIMGMIWSSGGS